MSYQVLARKYRPRSFDTLVGQAHVVQALKNALDQKRLHHAYLFTGTRGVGKTTLARILAKALNCKKGISSTPCGTCSACTEIDQGRYVDLIEVDAASNTQVDNMRDLLDNAQYAPTQEEAINYEINAIYLIAKSANGSMRDALSILDQGIAYCGGTIEEATIKKMLGAIDQSYLFNLVHAVIDQDGHKAIEIAKQMDERNLSFDAALNDLANLIQTISVTQAIPDSLEASYLDRDQVIALTKKISAEQLQLFYQITILGRRDLYLAPDEYAGFTMTILRMLSFTPQDSLIAKNSTPAKTEPVNSTNKIETIVKSNDVSSEASEIKKKIEVDHQVDESILKEIPAFNGNWRELVDQLKLGKKN